MTLMADTEPPPPHLVLQSPGLVSGARVVACDGFYGLPTTLPAYVAVVTDGSPLADREASLLRFELRRQILSLSGARLETVAIPCGSCPAYRDDFDCTALQRDRSQNVIVFIGDGTSPIAPSPPLQYSPGRTHGIVLTPPGAAVPPVPPWLAKTNVGRWQVSATEFAPLIFAAAGLTHPDARVFISYRVPETADLAEQLFEALAKRNFDVFVDRFRIDVGTDFQQRILQELAHKSMVVFIESAGILASKWTRYEIAVAKSARLGILALHLPGGTRIPDIDDSRRMDISPIGGVLDPGQLAAVVDRISVAQAASQLRRRQLLRQNMIRALNGAGVYRATVNNGVIEVEPRYAPSKTYSVWLPSRPADLSDFHYLATAASGGRRTIVGPAAHFVGVDRARMDWLAGVADVRSFDESAMRQVAAAMRQELL